MFAAQSGASTVEVTSSAVATPGLSGFLTHTVTLTASSGAIDTINLTFSASSMHQVKPFGLDTVFNDNNAAIVGTGGDVLQDSQFLFKSTDLLVIPPTSESAASLIGVFTIPAGSAELPFASRPIAQLVLPVGVAASFIGDVVLDRGGQQVPLAGVIPVPEPMSLLLLGSAALLARKRRTWK